MSESIVIERHVLQATAEKLAEAVQLMQGHLRLQALGDLPSVCGIESSVHQTLVIFDQAISGLGESANTGSDVVRRLEQQAESCDIWLALLASASRSLAEAT